MLRRLWRKRRTLKAVHDENLEELLSSLNLLSDLREGNLRCIHCDQPITLENLGAIIPLSDNLRVACNSSACLEAGFATMEESNVGT